MNSELIQYLTELMPLATVDCAGCTRQVEAGKAVVREGKFFHSQQCADIATAPMYKPQPKGTTVNGWDV